MTKEEQKKRINEFIENCERKLKKVDKEIDLIYNEIGSLIKTKKAAKENKNKIEELEDDFRYLKEEYKELETKLATYEFIKRELDLMD